MPDGILVLSFITEDKVVFSFEQKYSVLHTFTNCITNFFFCFGVICGMMNEEDYFQFHRYCGKY